MCWQLSTDSSTLSLTSQNFMIRGQEYQFIVKPVDGGSVSLSSIQSIQPLTASSHAINHQTQRNQVSFPCDRATHNRHKCQLICRNCQVIFCISCVAENTRCPNSENGNWIQLLYLKQCLHSFQPYAAFIPHREKTRCLEICFFVSAPSTEWILVHLYSTEKRLQGMYC